MMVDDSIIRPPVHELVEPRPVLGQHELSDLRQQCVLKLNNSLDYFKSGLFYSFDFCEKNSLKVRCQRRYLRADILIRA